MTTEGTHVDQFSWWLAELAKRVTALEKAVHRSLAKDQLLLGLSTRVAAQSELLGLRAARRYGGEPNPHRTTETAVKRDGPACPNPWDNH